MALHMDRANAPGQRFLRRFKSDDLAPSIGAAQTVALEKQESRPSSAAPLAPPDIEPRNGIIFASSATLVFLLVALALLALARTHLTVPRPGDIPGLHINYWIPPICAALGYLVLQCATRYLGFSKPSWQLIATRAIGDYLLLGLFILVVYVHFNIKMWVPVINPMLSD